MKKVSVIVPVYNVEKYIEKCLESIKAQSFDDFECLIINDGTKDNSVEIAKKTVDGDSRFIFYGKENGGLSDARNFGIEKAKGEYLCFIDSDDYIDKDLLKLSYDMAKKHGSDIVCFDMYYDWENRNLEVSKGANFNEITTYKENRDVIFINNSANNKLYRKEFLINRRFVKGMWYEDMAVIPVWLAKANNVSYVNKPLYYYVQREGSITLNADERIFDIYKALDMVKEKLCLDSSDIKDLYFENCLIMTTLRIKDFDDKRTRINYFKKNIDLLNHHFPGWYKEIKKEDNYSFKQKIIFYLFHKGKIELVDRIYNK